MSSCTRGCRSPCAACTTRRIRLHTSWRSVPRSCSISSGERPIHIRPVWLLGHDSRRATCRRQALLRLEADGGRVPREARLRLRNSDEADLVATTESARSDRASRNGTLRVQLSRSALRYGLPRTLYAADQVCRRHCAVRGGPLYKSKLHIAPARAQVPHELGSQRQERLSGTHGRRRS